MPKPSYIYLLLEKMDKTMCIRWKQVVPPIHITPWGAANIANSLIDLLQFFMKNLTNTTLRSNELQSYNLR
jgi:hypothetical protein